MRRTLEVHDGRRRCTLECARAHALRVRERGNTVACASTFMLHYILSTFIFGATGLSRTPRSGDFLECGSASSRFYEQKRSFRGAVSLNSTRPPLCVGTSSSLLHASPHLGYRKVG